MDLCPPYFSLALLPNGNSSCAPSCPLEYYSSDEYNVLSTSVNVFGIGAMISSFIALVPHFALKTRRRWPHVLLPTLFSCIFVLGLHFIFPIAGYAYDWRKLVCDSSTNTYHTGKTNGWCALDGAMTFAFAIAAVFQWGVVDVYLILRLFRVEIEGFSAKIRPLTQALIVYGTIITYVVVTVSISLKRNAFQGTGEGGHCFLAQGPYYDYLWIVPIIIIQVLAIINTIVILVYSIFVTRDTRTAINFFVSQWRILAFRGIFLGASASVTIFWAIWRPKNHEVVQTARKGGFGRRKAGNARLL